MKKIIQERQVTKRLVIVTAASAAAAVLAACGSSSSSPGSSSSSAPAAAGTSSAAAVGATSSPAGNPQAGIAIPKETGPADSSKSPVTIGLIGVATGPGAPVPSTFPVAKAAVSYVNDHLGGIDGHPVVLKTCDTTGDEQQTRICAQQFANDSSVDVVLQGHGDEYSEDIYPILQSAGLFTYADSPYTLADETSPDVVAYAVSAGAVSTVLAQYGNEKLGIKKWSIIGFNVPVGHQSAAAFGQQVKSLGGTTTSVFVNPAEADFTGPFDASGATSADGVVALIGAPQCVQLANTVAETGYKKPILTTNACWDPSVVQGAGSKIDGWYVSFQYAPGNLPAGQDPEVDFYNKVLKMYGAQQWSGAYSANNVFSSVIAIWSAAHADASADPTSKASWKGILTSYKGPVLMGPRSVSCPGPAPAPSQCSADAAVYQLVGGSNPYPADPVTIDTSQK